MKKIFIAAIKRLSKLLLVYDAIFKKKTCREVYVWCLKQSGVVFSGDASIAVDVGMDLSEKIYIGDNVTIGARVHILTHDYSVTKALVSSGRVLDKRIAVVKPVTIGDNTFIGAGSLILPGAVIGKNVIIGACSVVRGHVPDNVVAAGNPCKIIRSIEDHLDLQLKYNSEYFKTDV